MKVSCDVIKDILPLYAEDMVSNDTKELVDEHIGDCGSCKQELDRIQKKNEIALCTRDDALNKVKKIIRIRRIRAVLLAFLILLSVFVSAAAIVLFPFYISEEDAIETVYVNEDGGLVVKFKEGTYDYTFEWDDSRPIKHVVAYSNIWTWRSKYKRPDDPGGYELKFGLVENTDCIVYGWNNSLIWGEESEPHLHPELLALFGAMIAAFVSGIACILGYRKKKSEKMGKMLLHMGVFCCSYVAANLIAFKFDLRLYGIFWGRDVLACYIYFLVMTLPYYGTAMLIIKNRMDTEKL